MLCTTTDRLRREGLGSQKIALTGQKSRDRQRDWGALLDAQELVTKIQASPSSGWGADDSGGIYYPSGHHRTASRQPLALPTVAAEDGEII